MEDQTFIFSSKHARLDRYNIMRGEILVHEYNGKFSASHPVFGAGKEYATPEAAIVGMLGDHSCTVTVHGPKDPAATDTPRTDARAFPRGGPDAATATVSAEFARTLERELADQADRTAETATHAAKLLRERDAARLELAAATTAINLQKAAIDDLVAALDLVTATVECFAGCGAQSQPWAAYGIDEKTDHKTCDKVAAIARALIANARP